MGKTWKEVIITCLAMLLVAGVACISAFLFNEDGKVLLGCGLAIIALSNPELRKVIISYLPKYIPTKKK